MPVSSQKLASRIVDGVTPHLPAGFALHSAPDGLVVSFSGDPLATLTAVGIVADNDDRSEEERLMSAAVATLSGIQDVVSERLGEPWPTSAHRRMALPDCLIADDKLLCWYGTEYRNAVAQVLSELLADLV